MTPPNSGLAGVVCILFSALDDHSPASNDTVRGSRFGTTWLPACSLATWSSCHTIRCTTLRRMFSTTPQSAQQTSLSSTMLRKPVTSISASSRTKIILTPTSSQTVSSATPWYVSISVVAPAAYLIAKLNICTPAMCGLSTQMCGCSILFAVYEVVFSKWEHIHEEKLVAKNPHRHQGDSCARVIDTLQTVALMGLANLVRDVLLYAVMHCRRNGLLALTHLVSICRSLAGFHVDSHRHPALRRLRTLLTPSFPLCWD